MNKNRVLPVSFAAFAFVLLAFALVSAYGIPAPALAESAGSEGHTMHSGMHGDSSGHDGCGMMEGGMSSMHSGKCSEMISGIDDALKTMNEAKNAAKLDAAVAAINVIGGMITDMHSGKCGMDGGSRKDKQ